MKKRVLVAMSGGVDSAVAPLLLKDQSYEVVGVTMCLGVPSPDDGRVRCCGPQEIEDARRVCHLLGISHYVFDFSRDLEEKVVRPFRAQYLQGRTPNPCVECNRFIKFGSLLEKAQGVGMDYLATGHYATLKRTSAGCRLKTARDRRKDQTYFLYAVPGKALERVLFPLADLTKDAVREMARRARLPVSGKRESQDICFAPPEGYGGLFRGLSEATRPGRVVNKKGDVLGEHRGIIFYTVGQRRGLRLSWMAPLYVIAIDPEKNTIVVGEKPDLVARSLIASEVNLLVPDLPQRAYAKIRHTRRPAPCRISLRGERLILSFDEPQPAVTPGQSVALYDGDTVLGGGIISWVGDIETASQPLCRSSNCTLPLF
jgi:tRNA-specific 2-thiouridylase